MVEANPRVADPLRVLLHALAVDHARGSATTYRIDACGVDCSDEFVLRANGIEVGSGLDESTAVELLLWSVDRAAVRASDRYLLVHAAAAEREGRAVVLPGPSGAGKSTLVTALVGRGWRYLTDEVVALDLDDGGLVGYPRAVKLEQAAIVRRLPFAAGAAREIALVVFPSVHRPASDGLQPVRAVEAVATLAGCCWNLTSHRQRGLDLLAKLAHRPCARVELGQADAVASAIDAALAETVDVEAWSRP
jgi:hypothetical protein